MCTLREINEPYPNFVNFDFSNEVSDKEYVSFTDYLQSGHLNKLGDTNTGRLLLCSEIYLEAGADKCILETIDQGNKLMFIDNVSPPSFHRRNNLSALAQSEWDQDKG